MGMNSAPKPRPTMATRIFLSDGMAWLPHVVRMRGVRGRIVGGPRAGKRLVGHKACLLYDEDLWSAPLQRRFVFLCPQLSRAAATKRQSAATAAHSIALPTDRWQDTLRRLDARPA